MFLNRFIHAISLDAAMRIEFLLVLKETLHLLDIIKFTLDSLQLVGLIDIALQSLSLGRLLLILLCGKVLEVLFEVRPVVLCIRHLVDRSNRDVVVICVIVVDFGYPFAGDSACKLTLLVPAFFDAFE
jgi:hypothetical protein